MLLRNVVLSFYALCDLGQSGINIALSYVQTC